MIVLHINKSDQTGGAAVAARRLVNALIKNGVDARLMVEECLGDATKVVPLVRTTVQRAAAFGRFVLERLYFLPYERNKEVRFAFSPAVVGRSVAKEAAVQQADVLHLHWFNQGFLGLKQLRELLYAGKPVVWTLHDMWAFTGGCHYTADCQAYKRACGQCPLLKRPSADDLSARHWRQKAFVGSAPRLTLVACSEWMAKQARASSILAGQRVISIPNALDVSRFRPLDSMACRRKLGLPTDRPVVLFGAANLADPRKGFVFLKRALTRLLEERKNLEVHLLFFGKANESDFEGIPYHYTHVQHVSQADIVEYYSAATLMVVPSLQDNLPNTVMESLACGTPVLAFATGGIPEMIVHGKTGFLAEPGNHIELEQGIRWLIEGPQEKLRHNARQFVLENYSEEVVARRYAELYTQMLNEA